MSDSKHIVIYTIGHSNHSMDHLLQLLKLHSVDVVADVRSVPYTRHCPQFNKKSIASALASVNIAYTFLGSLLGGRPTRTACCEDGRVDFKRVASSSEFKEGLRCLLNIASAQRVALMCKEREPLYCHRMILISRFLKGPKISIKHILADGAVEDHEDSEQRLLKMLEIGPTLFQPRAEEGLQIEQAYEEQGRRIAHRIREASGLHELRQAQRAKSD